jgi:hypothetical protein
VGNDEKRNREIIIDLTSTVEVVVVVVISFTLTSPLRGYAGYHNYSYL